MTFATAAMPAAPSRACAAAGQAHGFGVEQMAPFVVDGVRVSSTAVRERLEFADYRRGGAPAGPPVSDDGPGGAAGSRLGRTLGFPTANLRLMRRKSPVWGILAVWVHGIDSRPLPGVASLGTRPTVNGIEPLLEAHVFDFSGDLYGRPIEVEFVAKLRDEVKFDSLEAMTVQMKIDARARARYLVEGGEWLITKTRSICRTRVSR